MEVTELAKIRRVLELHWTKKTAYAEDDPKIKDTKSRGQCYVTACALNKVLGWKVLFFKSPDFNHYWNIAPDGTQVDFTSDQFGGDGFFPIDKLKGRGRIKTVGYSNKRVKVFLESVEKELSQHGKRPKQTTF